MKQCILYLPYKLDTHGAGARMLITEAGRLCGTIGGGMVEYRSEQIAQEVLRGGGSRAEHFRLHKTTSPTSA